MPCNEEQAVRTGIVVEVLNIAPVIRDLKMDKVGLARKVDEEEYSDCLLDWVKDDRVK